MVFKSPRGDIEVPAMDILSYMFDNWAYDWDTPSLIDADKPEDVIPARTLLDYTKRVGKGLRDVAGVKPGEVVLVSAPNSILVPPALLGILCAGAIFSGTNPSYTAEELAYQMRDSRTRTILVGPQMLDTALESIKLAGLPKSSVYLITLEKGPVRGVRTLGDLMSQGTMQWEKITDVQTIKRRVVILNYSSGTTGLPKGCMLSVYNIIAQCQQEELVRKLSHNGLREQGIDVPKQIKTLAFLPFYHCYGQLKFIFGAVRQGESLYVLSAFSFPKLLAYVPKFGITSFPAAPPIVVQLAKAPAVRTVDFSHILPIVCGAAPLGRETQLQAEAALNACRPGRGNVRIVQGWGITECVGGVTSFALHERDPEVTGVGYLNPGMVAKLVDDEDREVGVDERGEVLLKGPNVFIGYWGREKDTKDAFTEDGWFKTGDIGIVRKSGIFHIVDRKKELIKVKGFQVAPAELEDLLLKSPDVDDVAVIGIYGEGTEHPRAYVKPAPSRASSDRHALAQDVIAFVSSRLAKHKHITGGVVFVDAIPKNPSGKILRRKLRDEAKTNVRKETVYAADAKLGELKAKL